MVDVREVEEENQPNTTTTQYEVSTQALSNALSHLIPTFVSMPLLLSPIYNKLISLLPDLLKLLDSSPVSTQLIENIEIRRRDEFGENSVELNEFRGRGESMIVWERDISVTLNGPGETRENVGQYDHISQEIQKELEIGKSQQKEIESNSFGSVSTNSQLISTSSSFSINSHASTSTIISSTLSLPSPDISNLLTNLSKRATVVFTLYDPDYDPTNLNLRENEDIEIQKLVEQKLEQEIENVTVILEKLVTKSTLNIAEITSPAYESSDEVVNEGNDWFQGVSMSFRDIRMDDRGINTVDILAAVEGVLDLFEKVSPSASALIKRSVLEDIRRVRVRYDLNPNSTLQEIVKGESSERRRLATEALLWIIRGMKFVAVVLERVKMGEELDESLIFGWRDYSKYFSFVIRPLFKIIVKGAPTRDSFMLTLLAEGNASNLDEHFTEWLVALKDQLDILESFYSLGKFDRGI